MSAPPETAILILDKTPTFRCWNEFSLIQSKITTPTERGNMSTVTFDTLELTDALKKAGIPRNKQKRW